MDNKINKKRLTMDKMNDLINQCINDMLNVDFLEKYIITYHRTYINCENILIDLMKKKLEIPEYSFKCIDDLFNTFLARNYSLQKVNKTIESINVELKEVQKNLYEKLKDILQGNNKDLFNILIDEKISIKDLCYNCIYDNLDENLDYQIKEKECYEVRNGYIKYFDINLLIKAIDLEMYDIIPYIQDDVFIQLPIHYIENIVHNSIDSVFLSGQERKIKYVLKNVNLITILHLYKKYIKDSIDPKNDYRNIYTYVDYIDEEDFYTILVDDLCYGIEFCKYVTQNEVYVKKLIENEYSYIIWGLEEHQFNGNLLRMIKESGTLNSAFIGYSGPFDILNSDSVFNIFVDHYTEYFDYSFLLKNTPKESLNNERRLTCLLNCDSPDYRSLDDIKYAIEHGYKCSEKTYLKNQDEVKFFIDNGQPEIINCVNSILLDLDTIKYAVEHGYKFDKSTSIKNFPYGTLKFCLENGIYDAIIPYFIKNRDKTEEIISEYINGNSYYGKDTNIVAFLSNIELSTPFIELIIIISDNMNYTDNIWILCAKERYKNKPEILNYLKLAKSMSDYVHSEEDIYKYFDAEGPKKELYDLALTKKNLYAHLFENDEWKSKYNPKKAIKQYIEFINKNDFIYDKIKTKEDIFKYFDKNGPKKELYDLALIRSDLFHVFINDDWQNFYKPEPVVRQYIEFINKNRFIPYYIRTKKDIFKYFDELGPKKETYDMALTSSVLFNFFFDDDEWKSKYNPEEEIKRYIEFSKKYGLILNQYGYVKVKSDIFDFFDESGVSEKFKIYLKNNKERTEFLINSLAHDDRILRNISEELVNVFEYYVIDRYFKDVTKESQKEKYDYLLKHVGPRIIFNFENKNINKLINKDIKDMDKLFSLLNSAKYKVVPSNIAYDNIVISLINFELAQKYPDIVNIFSNINSLVINMSNEEFENYVFRSIIGPLSEKLNKLCFEVIKCLKLDKSDIEDFKQALIECKNFKEDKLRKYCRKYLKKQQSDYLDYRRKHILSELDIPLRFDRNDGIDKLFIYLQDTISYQTFDSYRNKMINNVKYKNIETKNFIEQINMTRQEYDVILSITENEFNSIISNIKNNSKPEEKFKTKSKLFKRFLKQVAIYKFDNESINNLLQTLEVNKDYFVVLKDLDVLNILSELDINIFLNTVAKDDKILENLSRVFEWFFIGRLPENFSFFFEAHQIKLPGGINNIGGFITKYYSILLQKERLLKAQGTKIDSLSDIRFFFTEIVQYISKFNSETIEIKRLLGSKEYDDFVSNPRNNSADFSRLEREEKLVNILDFLYTLDKVTIPSKDIVISNKDNTKQINFIIGNRTNSSNICHGERTGSCMRVGGIGEGLFLKCLTDKNWFHIRIEDPVTHEYISRVSGFRNGNTVYLNQLRDSSNTDKYSNKDLQGFIKLYAKTLIEDTKSSEYPIENVFINTNYAMNDYQDKEFNNKTYTLGYDIQREYNLDDVLEYRLKNSEDIWTDVKSNAYLLATTENGAKTMEGYVPIKNGPENAESYDSVRDKIYGLEYIDEYIPIHQFVQIDKFTLKEKINRVHGMKIKLLDKDYRYDIVDKVEVENEIIDGYASSDWYVYIDSSYEIHYEYIEEIHKDGNVIPYGSKEKAIEEMEKHKVILINKYDFDNKNYIV